MRTEGIVSKNTLLVWLVIAITVSAVPVQAKVIYERDSLYSHITVKDERGGRTLYCNSFPQTYMSLDDPNGPGMEYAELFHATLAFQPDIQRVLILGLGGGSTSKAFLLRYPDMTVDTVEIDPIIVEVAKRFFYLPTTDRHQIFTEDARRYLTKTAVRYDAILVDAYFADYYGGYIPFHLVTQEFFTLARSQLNPGGVLAYNVVGQIGGWNDYSLRSLYRTMSATFSPVYLIPARSMMNVVMMAVAGTPPVTFKELKSRAATVDAERGQLPTSITSVTARVSLQSLFVDDVPTLRDDYAPIETLSLFRR